MPTRVGIPEKKYFWKQPASNQQYCPIDQNSYVEHHIQWKRFCCNVKKKQKKTNSPTFEKILQPKNHERTIWNNKSY